MGGKFARLSFPVGQMQIRRQRQVETERQDCSRLQWHSCGNTVANMIGDRFFLFCKSL
jgi:hypothetical protein